MEQLKPPVKRLNWRFGLWWVLATALGWVVGFTICEGVKSALLSIRSSIGAPDGALIGTGIGLVQWLVLSRYLPRAGWWIPATILGFAIGKAAGDSLAGHITGLLGFALGGAMIGFLVGIAQWCVLSKKIPKPGWWILASAVGWAAGWTIINIMDESAGGPISTIYLIGALGAAVAGLITGAAMVRLSQINPEPAAENR